MLNVKEGTFEELRQLKESGREGMVFLGCGGDIKEWLVGIPGVLIEEEKLIPNDQVFEPEVIKTVTVANHYKREEGGRIDLTFLFKEDAEGVDWSRLPLWRLRWGDCSWLSDWVDNYASHYGQEPIEEEEDEEYEIEYGWDISWREGYDEELFEIEEDE